jgi:hypothetical protein
MVWFNLHTNDAAASSSEKKCKSCARMLPMMSYSLNGTAANRRSKCKDCHNRDQNLNRPCRKAARAEEPAKRQRLEATVPGEHLYIMAFSFDPIGAQFGLKVGRSGDIARRAHELANSMPHTMLVLASFPGLGHLEDQVHATLAPTRNTGGRGREWFHTPLPNILIAVVCAMQAPTTINGSAVGSAQQRPGSPRCCSSLACGQEAGPACDEEGGRGLCEGQGFETDFSSGSTCEGQVGS